MTVLNNIQTSLSTEKNRKFFLFVAFLVLTVTVYYLYKKLSCENCVFEIGDIVDFTQMILISLSSYVLYKITDKSEVTRYIENYKFYLKRYSRLEKDFIKIVKNQTDDICFFSASVILNIPNMNSNIKLKDIRFKLRDDSYTLPLLIEEQFKDILIQKFNIQEKTDYNALTLSLKQIYFDNIQNTLTFEVRRAYYFHALVTNLIPEYELLHNLTVRDYLESPNMKTFTSLEDSLAANHLGISCLVSVMIEEQKYFILPKRSLETAVFKGQLAPSISGAANIHSFKESEYEEISIKTFFKYEFAEELAPLISKITNQDKEIFYTNMIDSMSFIGITRELKRLGKPEVFFYYDSNLGISNAEVYKHHDIIEINLDSLQVDSGIDSRENEVFYLVRYDKVLELLEQKIIQTNNINSFEGEEIFYYFDYNNKKLRISESLFVNLALVLKKH